MVDGTDGRMHPQQPSTEKLLNGRQLVFCF